VRRLLAVHAHPDDETLATGGTLATYAADVGTSVTLVTCTLGQRGEVIPPALQHLSGDALGRHRRGELAAAMEALGVADHRLLADGRWVDSGMVWLQPGIAGAAPDAGPDAFALADVDEAASQLAQVVREVRPHVVLTYDPQGGYGHPDHVQAHRVTVRALEIAGRGGARAWQPAATFWPRVPRSWAERERAAALTGRPSSMSARDPQDPYPPVVVDDDVVDAVVDVRPVLEAKVSALRAHATQVRVEGTWFALSDGVAQEVRGHEAFQLAATPGGAAPRRPGPAATDLFAGVRTDG
jgi:N-acetyl-1-D-myo-inositol-2-amino-2-deoxy-alpha-D-glucopyranoside deacetylase